jgi:hypothetical protein
MRPRAKSFSSYWSVGAPLKLPRCFEGVLDGANVTRSEVGDKHHVLDVPGRNAKGSGKLPHHSVAVAEIGADHHMSVIELAGNQPAVVTPLGEPIPRGAAHARQFPGQAGHVVDAHLRGLPAFAWSYTLPT